MTGPPENFITGLTLGYWAVNENNKSLWEKRIKAGDRVYFHSTSESGYAKNCPSCIIGFATVGERRFKKEAYWWIQEINQSLVTWPYVFDLQQAFLFGDAFEKIDLKTPLKDKAPNVVVSEIMALTSSGITLKELNKLAKAQNLEIPSFPVNGSMSGFNQAYEALIINWSNGNLTSVLNTHELNDLDAIDELVIENTISKELQAKPILDLLADCTAFKQTTPSHGIGVAPQKFRIENAAQKKRVALIEGHTCQVCRFKCEYTNAKGEKAYIIDIDHIVDKADGGTEESSNLWALCPNCHRKKTRGIIKINPASKAVTVDGVPTKIHVFPGRW